MRLCPPESAATGTPRSLSLDMTADTVLSDRAGRRLLSDRAGRSVTLTDCRRASEEPRPDTHQSFDAATVMYAPAVNTSQGPVYSSRTPNCVMGTDLIEFVRAATFGSVPLLVERCRR